MITFKNGTIDPRHVVDTTAKGIAIYAIVINEDGTFGEVCIDDSHSTAWDEPIYGGPLYVSYKMDATPEERETYRKHKRQFQKGDQVVITRGRKMVGETKVIKGFSTFVPTYARYGVVEYINFTDGTKVNRSHVDFA